MDEGGEQKPGTEPELASKPEAAQPQQPPVMQKQHHKLLRGVIIVLLVAIVGVCAYGVWHGHHKAKTDSTKTTTKTSTVTKPKVAGLQLDTAKNYGDKYADGMLPVGDGKYVTTTAKTGYIYACSGYAQNIQRESGGAGKQGPWFSADGKTYNVNKKTHVVGSVMWQAEFTNTVSGSTRTITTNDLPTHPTGIFPIQASDPAYQYDRNPNSITSQALTYALAADPVYNTTPTCESGTVGVMLTGVQLNNGFDAGGRDAGAWEVQDSCDGHPQSEGLYHYHTLSSCIKDTSVKTVIGYALDGFPITGPKVGVNGTLTTSDLDECHGIVSAINVGGTMTTMYHYVMTQDFPYSVSCFHGTPIDPPGLKPLPH